VVSLLRQSPAPAIAREASPKKPAGPEDDT
jgi:hypothetical protein